MVRLLQRLVELGDGVELVHGGTLDGKGLDVTVTLLSHGCRDGRTL